MIKLVEQFFAQYPSASLIERVGWTLVHSCWQFAAMWILVFAIDRLLKAGSAALRYAFLSSSLFLLLFIPFSTWMLLPEIENRTVETVSTAGTVSIGDATSELSTSETLSPAPHDHAVLIPVQSQDIAFTPLTSSNSTDSAQDGAWIVTTLITASMEMFHPWLRMFVVFWCAGVSLFSIRILWSWAVVRRLRTCHVSSLESLDSTVKRLCENFGMSRVVRVLQSELVDAPIVVGCFRSVILLPVRFVTHVPTRQLEAILTHELVHVRRYDYLANLVQTFVETIFFFHPTIWWLSHRIRVERENSCDDLVVKLTGDRVEYGRALLAVEEFRCERAYGLALSAGTGTLTRRVRRLFSIEKRGGANGRAGSAVVTISLIAMIASTVFLEARATARDRQVASPRVEQPVAKQDLCARLSPNAQLELLGVRSIADSTGWHPNGAPLRIPSDWPAPLRVRGDEPSHDLVFRARGIATDQGFVWDRSLGDRRLTVPVFQDRPNVFSVSGQFAATHSASIRVGITDPWGPWHSVSGDGEIRGGAKLDKRHQRTYRKLREFRVIGKMVLLKGIAENQDIDYEIRAIDKDGQRHPRRGVGIWKDGGFQVPFFDTDNWQVDHWEFRLREVRHWVTFHEFALQSGKTTAPRVSVESSIDSQPPNELDRAVSANGEIHGRLVDDEGRPVASAIVSCGAIYREDGQSGGARTTTDSDGRYELLVPSPGIYTVFLKAYESDKTRTAAADDGLRVQPGQVTQSRMRLVTGRKVTGRVVDDADSPVSRMKVMCYSSARPISLGGVQSAVTNDSGEFEFYLPPGPARVYGTEPTREAEDGSRRKRRTCHRNFVVPKAETMPPLTLTLAHRTLLFGSSEWLERTTPGSQIVSHKDRAEVTGVVVNSAGAPIPGVMVVKSGGTPVLTNDQGRFQLPCRKGTQFVMHAFQPGYRVWFGAPTAGDDLKVVMTSKSPSLGDATLMRPGRKRGNRNSGPEIATNERSPWRVRGRVFDQAGKPLRGVVVKASTGIGTLRGGAQGVTDELGRYDFRFGMGIRMSSNHGQTHPQTQYAVIAARYEGHFERNLCRHGMGIGSLEPVSAEELKHWGVESHQVCLPNEPREVNFVMLPAAQVSGTLVDEESQPLQGYSVSLMGTELPPASSSLGQAITDENGRFTVSEIPTSFAYQVQVRKPRRELKPPWDDSWASPPMRFADPGQNDCAILPDLPSGLRRRFVVGSLRLQVEGAGIHGKTALRRATERSVPIPLESTGTVTGETTRERWTLTLSNRPALSNHPDDQNSALEDEPNRVLRQDSRKSARSDRKPDSNWLKYCPGSKIMEHTDAQFVSGTVVDENGQPIADCQVSYPGEAIVKTDASGQFRYRYGPSSQFVLRVMHPGFQHWYGAPSLGDKLRIVMQKQRRVPETSELKTLSVRVIDSRTAEPLSDIIVTAIRWEGPKSGTHAAAARTGHDGVARLVQLERIHYQLKYRSDSIVPYARSRNYVSAENEAAVILLNRTCELVLRAVDNDTGKGIPGVSFFRENADGEYWAQPIKSDSLGLTTEGERRGVTDEDGVFRCRVGSYPWSYGVIDFPAGYDSVSPVDGRREFTLQTPVGGRVEHTFRLTRIRD